VVQASPRRVRVGHSPDPDDAFMFYGIASGRVSRAGFEIDSVLEDIESLNRRALRAELEVTAVSVHAYPRLAAHYALMSCGASMGEGYGPRLVARKRLAISELASCTIAVPGTLTSAFLALRLFLGRDFAYEVVAFDHILERVASGRAAAGLLIHEGQLTYADHGLERIVDLGRWWAERTDGLPLPLGANAVRKDLGPAAMRGLTGLLRDSIDYGLAHRADALRYALGFGRGLDPARNDAFVGMYVNRRTLDCGDDGRRAIERFLREGVDAGLVPAHVPLEFIES
jgi:1,4-dihydroxy-6-naphthoate synthase